MEPNSIISLPHIDKNGYFDRMVSCMVGEDGSLMIGADCYQIDPPADDGKHFYKLSADKASWEEEKIPETPEEFVGIILEHHDQTERVHRLRAALDDIAKANSEKWRVHQDSETNNRSLEAVPELTEEEKAEQALETAKAERSAAVAKLVVEVDGMRFDADEESQTRMGRTVAAAVALGVDLSAEKRTWVLADNSIAEVSCKQLAEALRLAGDAQTELWIVPYQ